MENINAYAYDVLSSTNQNKFPIDINKIIEHYGITIMSLSESEGFLKSLNCWEYAKSVKAVSLCRHNQHYIIYSDELSNAEQREAIAHEIGHIVLNHLSFNGILGKSDDPNAESKQENEANAFLLALLAPIPLLLRKGISDPDVIQAETRLSREKALLVAGNLVSKKRNSFQQKMGLAIATLLGIITLMWILQTLYSAPNPHQSPSPAMNDITTSPPVIQKAIEPSNIPKEDVYYWTQGGKVYHKRETCTALKNVKYPIQHGTLEEAKLYKNRLCNFCGE